MSVATIEDLALGRSTQPYNAALMISGTVPFATLPTLVSETATELVYQDGAISIRILGSGLSNADATSYRPDSGTITSIEVQYEAVGIDFKVSDLSIDGATFGAATDDPIALFELLFVRDGEIRASLVGTPVGDLIEATGGGPTAPGSAGQSPFDPILLSPSRFTVDGGAGHDRIIAEDGNDTLSGGSGNDRITGGMGHDLIDGGTGFNRIDGGLGDDTLDVDFAFRLPAVQLDTFTSVVGSDIPIHPLMISANKGTTLHRVVDVETIRYSDGTVVEVGSTEIEPGFNLASIEVARLEPTRFASVTHAIDPNGDGTNPILGWTHVDGRVQTNTFDVVFGEFDDLFTIRLSQRTVTDDANAYSWTSRTTAFDEAGQPTSLSQTNDNGVTLVRTFDNGVRDTSVFTDVADAFQWADRTVSHDDNGVREATDWTYDDGRTRTDSFVDGVIRSRVWVDVDDAYDWHQITRLYDETGTFVSEDTVFDV